MPMDHNYSTCGTHYTNFKFGILPSLTNFWNKDSRLTSNFMLKNRKRKKENKNFNYVSCFSQCLTAFVVICDQRVK